MPNDPAIAGAVNRLLRHHVATILLNPGDHPLKDALRDLASSRRPGASDADALEAISPPIGRADLAEPREAALAVIARLQADGPQQAGPAPGANGQEPLGDGHGGATEPGEDGGNQPPDRPRSPPERDRPRTLPEPRLILELTRVQAERLTSPQANDDEFIVTGGYVYSTGNGPLTGWRRDIANSLPVTIDPPHILSSVPVLAGEPQHFNATIILFEEDWADAETATALGRVISIALNLGIEALVNYLTASGLPAALSPEARDLLTNHGITGVRSWFESWAGPETFEIFMLRATTNWPVGQPWQPVPWDSWITHHPDVIPTIPPSSVGPATHVGSEITAREAVVENGPNGPVMTVVADGGIYKLNFQFRLVA